MCLEAFHPEQPIVIRYENEVVEFIGNSEIRGVYCLLIQNAGRSPIERLSFLYPSWLPKSESGNPADLTLDAVSVLDAPLTLLGGEYDASQQRFTLNQPDPNRPQFLRPPLSGEWLPNKGHLTMSLPGSPIEALQILECFGTTFFQLEWEPDAYLAPNESRWIVLEISCQRPCTRIDQSVLGCPVIIHQLASPYDVRHTTEELLEQIERALEGQWLSDVVRNLRQDIGIIAPRRVDMEYYELTVYPGPATERFVIDWHAERDLRMRSNSPRMVLDHPDTPPLHRGEMVFDWKSGSMLKPDGYPWKHEGFFLHLTFACKS